MDPGPRVKLPGFFQIGENVMSYFSRKFLETVTGYIDGVQIAMVPFCDPFIVTITLFFGSVKQKTETDLGKSANR